jgi:hypothetical protein
MDKLFVSNTIYYTLIKEKITKLKSIEKIVDISTIEKELDLKSRLLFLTTIIGFSCYDSGRNEDALKFYDKASLC